MSDSMRRAISDIIDELLKQGWRIRQGRHMHHVAYPPDPTKKVVSIASTPSDHRALHRIRSDLRRSGARI